MAGACVATCGEDGAVLGAALGTGLRVVRGYCGAPTLFGVVPATDACGSMVLEVSGSSTATDTMTYAVSAWTLEELAEPTTHTHGNVDVQVPGGGQLFLGGYVKAPVGGSRVAFGYTRSTDFGGEVLVLSTTGANPVRVDAPGNYDVAWLDADTLLVNGLGAGSLTGAQSLYRFPLGGGTPVALLANAGDASGAVAFVPGLDVVLYGAYGADYPAASGNNLVFALPRARLDAVATGATGALDLVADTTVPRFEAPSDFRVVGENLLVAFNWTSSRWESRQLTDNAGTLALGAAQDFADGAVFSAVAPAGTGHALLAHAGGWLLVEVP